MEEKKYFGLTVVEWLWVTGLAILTVLVLEHAMELEAIRIEKNGY
tara:strand:+ start:649 stop:783 length:135 start_codon:yes stop_codon:yes gene_type:complete